MPNAIEKRQQVASFTGALAVLAMLLAPMAWAGPAVAAAVGPGVCPALRWVTLGTAGGPVPTADRSEPANLLIAGEERILVDTGDGTVDQLARLGMDLGPVRHVFISHHHHDHTGGLAAVIGLRWMNNFPGQLTVHGPVGTREMVDGIVASLGPQGRIGFGLGKPPPPPAASVKVVEIAAGESVAIGDLRVTTAANTHFDHGGAAPESAGPSSAAAPQSLSYRFELGNRSITFTGDTGPSEAVTRLAQHTDLLVSEVIDLDRLLAEIRLRRSDMPPAVAEGMRQHLSTHHLVPVDVGRMAAAAGVKHLVLTHFAVPGLLIESEPALRSGVGGSYAGTVDLARDLASFSVGCP